MLPLGGVDEDGKMSDVGSPQPCSGNARQGQIDSAQQNSIDSLSTKRYLQRKRNLEIWANDW